MIKIIGGSGFVGSRLGKEIENFEVFDIKLPYDKGYVDITKRETLSSTINAADIIVLLAAEHKDDVSPISKYYETNVIGTQNVLDEMDRVGCKHLIFTSSVAVYGLNKDNPNESHTVDPFNHYGKSKWEAEMVIKAWYDKDPTSKSVTVIRPTVIFGEKNRGNVYNLLRQIASGKFLMIGKGQNEKSMAYVGNVVAFIKHRLELAEEGYHVFNYVDMPDLTMMSLLNVIENSLKKKIPSIHIPILLGYFFGFGFDFFAFVSRKKQTISSVRVKKFVATTKFDATKVHSSGFKAPYALEEGLDITLNYEFVDERSEHDEVFYTE
jgi:nucleoside-diphosphate-sugar epimerase